MEEKVAMKTALLLNGETKPFLEAKEWLKAYTSFFEKDESSSFFACNGIGMIEAMEGEETTAIDIYLPAFLSSFQRAYFEKNSDFYKAFDEDVTVHVFPLGEKASCATYPSFSTFLRAPIMENQGLVSSRVTVMIGQDGSLVTSGIQKDVMKDEKNPFFYHTNSFEMEIVPTSWFQEQGLKHQNGKRIQIEMWEYATKGVVTVLNATSKRGGAMLFLASPRELSEEQKETLSLIYPEIKKWDGKGSFLQSCYSDGQYIKVPKSFSSLDQFYDDYKISKLATNKSKETLATEGCEVGRKR